MVSIGKCIAKDYHRGNLGRDVIDTSWITFAHSHVCKESETYGIICVSDKVQEYGQDIWQNLRHEYAHILDLEGHVNCNQHTSMTQREFQKIVHPQRFWDIFHSLEGKFA